MDVTCTKIILSMLGIHMDRPKFVPTSDSRARLNDFHSTATVHNPVAYRALGLEIELWAFGPLGVTSLYLQHFEYLLWSSKHARYNVLRTFQKSGMVKKLLYALRSDLFDPNVVPVVVGEENCPTQGGLR